MSMLKLRKKESSSVPDSPSINMDEKGAALAIQAWFEGNSSRIDEEREDVVMDLQNGATGASGYLLGNQLNKRKTMRMTQVNPNLNKSALNQQFYEEAKFKAFLKGLIDVQGRMTEPFSIIIVFGPRMQQFDKDYTKYPSYVGLHINRGTAFFSVKIDNKVIDIDDQTDVVISNMDPGVDDYTIQTYWFSYDRDNMVLKYGKGYAMTETTLLICDLSEGANTAEKLAKKRKQWSKLFAIYDATRNSDINILIYRSPKDMENRSTHKVGKGEVAGFINMEKTVEVRKEPLTANPSPFVMDSERATLNIIDKSLYIFSSELPPACQVLYETIKNCELDLEYSMGISEVRLSDAIRYSITTEGALLNKILKNKAYLRITMGRGRGESPGIPYVLEIWPKGARSPIHNHGAVCAVIKVLLGTIQSGVYNKVTSTVYDSKGNFKPVELAKINLFKDEVTWMSPEWYQTHQLRNVSDDYCATVQCYRYEDKDDIQWNQFDFVKDENGEVGNFFPNTDFTFGEMRDRVIKEWTNRMV